MVSGNQSNDILHDLYYNVKSPVCFSGVQKLFSHAKNKGIKLKDVKKFLEQQDTYTLHKPIRRKFVRNKTHASGIDTDWQADLCDMKRFKKFNDGQTYILTVIDVLSKHAWAEPVENKKPETMVKAFEKILESSDRKPWRLLTDKGKEFIGAPFQSFLKDKDIQFIQTESPDIKASIAERYNRTLKTRLWKYFTKNSTYRYIDVLPAIVHAINNSYHRSIKRKPVDVNYNNAQDVWETLYGEKKPVKFKFKIGDNVRIGKHKTIFDKGYLPNFTEEIFVITERLGRQPPVYKIKDLQGEPVTGIFYEQELVKVVKEEEIYKIEKVIRKRKRNNKTEILVKWVGYPDKFNQWIPQSDLITN